MKGNKLLISSIALAALGGVMLLTNPQPPAYTEYASKRFIAEAGKVICAQTGYCDMENLPVIGKNTFKNTLLKPAIENATKRNNFLLFSIYTTEFPGVATVKTLGILGNFITYQ
jgi:hypothetical protein